MPPVKETHAFCGELYPLGNVHLLKYVSTNRVFKSLSFKPALWCGTGQIQAFASKHLKAAALLCPGSPQSFAHQAKCVSILWLQLTAITLVNSSEQEFY